MKVDIRDVQTVQALRPLEVVAYLRSRGWTSRHSDAQASVWVQSIDGEEFETVVPLDQSVGDYALRMGELLQTLAVAESRSQLQIYSDLQTSSADVVRIRIRGAELEDGTIPLDEHVRVAKYTRDLLLAAACAVTERRAVWQTKKPAQVIEQVRKIRIGQSERGSYVFTVISRVSPELHTPQNGERFVSEPPFERRIIQTLATSLGSLESAAETAAISGEYEAFEEAVTKGVSANLCDAVAGLWGNDEGRKKLEFLFSWSPGRRVDPTVPTSVAFAADRIPVIREASRVMKERDPVKDFELEGAVVKLDRTPTSTTGRATIVGSVEGKAKRVMLELEEADYRLAVEAHAKERPLRCVGLLVRDGRSFVLQHPRDVVVNEEA